MRIRRKATDAGSLTMLLALLLLPLATALKGMSLFDDECPPCFNCKAPGMECTHFGDCNEYSGICDCPAGFGGADCAEPVCGSLPRGQRRPIRPENSTCSCDDGWAGVNCNMCTRDNACAAMMPGAEPGTCYSGGLLVRENYHMCNVTNRKIKDVLAGRVAEVSFGCNRNSTTCDLQLWVDQQESFFCEFSECEFEGSPETNATEYNCAKIQCQCVPDRLLCGADGSIDISEWLVRSVKGPGELKCDGDGDCTFSEPAMNQLIQFVFGDKSIELDCLASECVHYSEIPGWNPPGGNENSPLLGAVAILLVVSVLGLALAISRRIFYTPDKPVSLPHGAPSSHLQADPVALTFKDLGYRVGDRHILKDIYGSANAGSVMAIMGGSGAGKTTLLDILARKNKRGHVHGHLYVNGQRVGDKHVSEKTYKRVVGFVDQEDVLISTLTVYETVATSALLRLPRTMSDESKKMRALETLAELGILHLKDRLVGSETERGLSGGEKRRVAIACELVTSPGVLFLDEPTSGLDAYNAFNVVECLVGLARNYNRTVVFTIHQPRSNIVALFDRLMLLAEGRLVFTGTPGEAATHFASLGMPCPPGYNVADFLIDLTMKAAAADALAVAPSDPAIRGMPDEVSQTVTAVEPISDADAQVQAQAEDAQDPCQDPNNAEDPTAQWADVAYHRQQIIPQATNEDPGGIYPLITAFNTSRYAAALHYEMDAAMATASGQPLPAGYPRVRIWRQFVILSKRTFKNLYRNPMLVLTHYSISVALGLVCGLLYFHVANDISGFQNRLGLFFFLLALFGFSTLTTLSLFAQERIVFMRERANGYYSPISYYAAKVLLDIVPLRVVPPLLLGLIVYPLVGLNLNDGAPWKFLLILVLFNLSAATIMLVIGILIPDFGVASLVGCLVNLFGILFAGLFLNQQSMPVYAAWLRFLSIFHYAYEALSVNEVRYLSLIEDKFGLKIEVPGATILSAFGFDNGAVPTDIAGLGVIAVTCLILGYVVLAVFLVERR